jgi:C4-dicarboxylate-specific signal transduction histidine kinase
LLLPMLWSAKRFGLVGAGSTLFAIAGPAVFLAVEGVGSFALMIRRENAVDIALLYLSLAIPVLMLAATTDELRRSADAMARDAAALREGRDRLTVALKAARVAQPTGEVASKLIVGEMHAAVTHQINQPLGAILNNAEAGIVLLQSGKPSMEDIESILIDVRADALRASEISHRVRALMQFQELRREEIDLSRTVQSVLELLRDQAVLRAIVIEARLGADVRVHADPVHLEQVLLNLVVNAMDAMTLVPDGRRKIVIQTGVTNGGVEVSVSDTGSGIAPEKLAHIFEPFHTTKSRGMGMGLSIVRFIIRAHGGDISAANNEPGPGATFRFVLPAAYDTTTHAADQAVVRSELEVVNSPTS